MKMFEINLIPLIQDHQSHLSNTQEAEKTKFRLAAGHFMDFGVKR